MKHTHKYQRKNIGRSKENPFFVYQCTLANCTHYIREKLILGKNSFCWSCEEEFTIHPIGNQPYKRKPICDSCWKKAYGKEEGTDQNIEALLKAAGAL